ncbi:hypothetical protein [Criblamydia sequanensis]|uniref:N-acetyltransferase domain-containing protein n=1 Tax=Candidatus Criblamydia sequanensis CRIB-18 TaxID=1437425 RepID=A0A090CZR0_9BACT|nr:hypothetical protein [Criblamydia sequanensis]CDR32960.1 conserved hypothetical protein [Criblamydia sequanensis CRIB-18]
MPEIRVLEKEISSDDVWRDGITLAGPSLSPIYFNPNEIGDESFGPNIELIRLGAFDQKGTLQALALISYSSSPSLSELSCLNAKSPVAFSLYAEPLLDEVEKILKEKNCMIVCCLYEHTKGSPRSPLSLLLEKKGFGSPSVKYIKYYFDCYAFKPPWFTKEMTLQEDFKIFPWKDLTPKEENRLRQLEEQFSFHPFISPTNEKIFIQYINSLGLKYKGDIVGWMITHTLPYEKEWVRYSGFFIDPQFQHQGFAIPLLQQSIKLQQNSPLRWSYFMINLDYTESDWIRFVEKRLAPYTTKIGEVIRRCKAYR